MIAELELFFTIRSQWLIDGRVDALARIHSLPTAFYQQDSVRFASSREDLHRVFQDAQDDLLRKGIVRLRPRILDSAAPQRRGFPVLVENHALDRFDQTVQIRTIRFYLRNTPIEGYKIEMQEHISLKIVVPAPQPPYTKNVVH